MATTLRQITDRVDALVRAAAPVGTTVWRDRADAISRDECPAVNQLWQDVATTPLADDWDAHEFEFELQIHVRGEPMTPAAEDLHEPLHIALTGDATLRTLADSVRIVQQGAERAEADQTSGRKTARYRFKFTTPRTAL